MIAAAALCLIALVQTPSPVKGELCVSARRGERRCAPAVGRRFELPPAEHEREIVWWSEDGTELAVAPVGGKATVVDLESEAWRPIDVRFASTADDEWPLPVTLEITGASGSGVLTTLPAKRVATLRRLFVPAGDVQLRAAASHHRQLEKAVAVTARSIGTLLLQRVPVVSGTVVAGETPVAGATVRAGEDGPATETDALGRFRLALPETWPEVLRITAPGHAPKYLPLSKAEATLDTGTIRLQRGGRLRAVLADAAGVERADLMARHDGRSIRVATATPAEGIVDFGAVDAGDYRLILRGAGPLQRLVLPVGITEGEDRSMPVSVQRIRLLLRVTADRRPTAADVTIAPASSEWESALAIPAEGEATHEFWQEGELVATVSTPSHDGFIFPETIHPTDGEARWEIDLPTKKVLGRVTGADGEPLQGARIALQTILDDGAITFNTTSDAAGAFQFTSVAAGEQNLTVSATGHLRDTQSFRLAEDTAEHRLVIRLRRAAVRSVRVVDPVGRPLPKSLVVQSARAGRDLQTDDTGTAALELQPGERTTLFLFPPAGSFAIVDIEATRGSESSPVIAVVPPGTATIRVIARTRDDKPVPGVFFAVRYNGVMLPAPVRYAMLNRRGIPVQTGADGTATLNAMPAGMYELWSYLAPRDAQRVESGTVEPEARLAVQPGVNTVTFTFDAAVRP